ncbi:hypothetical protein BU23DRAFT_127499 [Bimuria novae-zelandiae CBS 107.79]|uniref:Uncharacterized protein n=1 Tax=Bimuria novae-zelandiae CBS 107.79 TaxID=1447943 RepID=A0A6A5V926_9PLEO|nr:hypothetical protein BU23DRAFT_127499 [Bimuria novae-zelandiae CBS 107.79]
MAAVPPFQLKGKALCNPPETTAWQRSTLPTGQLGKEYDSARTVAYLGLAEHWMNERYVCERTSTTMKEFPDEPFTIDAIIDSYPWILDTSGGVKGYLVKVSYSPWLRTRYGGPDSGYEEYHICARDDQGWMERIDHLPEDYDVEWDLDEGRKVRFFSRTWAMENGERETTRYFQDDGGLKGNRDTCYQYWLRTSNEACGLY